MKSEKLIKIQTELKAPKNQYNSFGKYYYRNQEDILEAVKPLLLKHDCMLVLTDCVKDVCGVPYVDATAEFYDNEICIKTSAQAGVDLSAKGMSAAQAFGASSSYARKYALGALFLIDDTKDADATNTHGKTDWTFAFIGKCESIAQLEKVWNENTDKHTDKVFINEIAKRKAQLK